MTDNPILEEYKVCHETARHIDQQNAYWGSLIFGGSIAAAGFVLSQRVGPLRLFGLAVLSTVLLVGYILLIYRSDGVKAVCFARMREIEQTHFNAFGVESRIHYLRTSHSYPDYPLSRKPITIFRVREFHILSFMVSFYIVALWLGTAVVWSIDKFTPFH